jgi:hypothetical protein
VIPTYLSGRTNSLAVIPHAIITAPSLRLCQSPESRRIKACRELPQPFEKIGSGCGSRCQALTVEIESCDESDLGIVGVAADYRYLLKCYRGAISEAIVTELYWVGCRRGGSCSEERKDQYCDADPNLHEHLSMIPHAREDSERSANAPDGSGARVPIREPGRRPSTAIVVRHRDTGEAVRGHHAHCER